MLSLKSTKDKDM